jgi:hypothetical protein
MKADPVNIAIVFLVVMNTLAAVQFQALTRTAPPGMSTISAIEIARDNLLATVRS